MALANKVILHNALKNIMVLHHWDFEWSREDGNVSSTYALVVGSLMYATICTRPDIAQAVRTVSRFIADPDREHWNTVKRILRYIKGTSGATLCFGGSEFVVRGYVDLDFVGDIDKRKSTTGYVFTLTGRAVSCYPNCKLL